MLIVIYSCILLYYIQYIDNVMSIGQVISSRLMQALNCKQIKAQNKKYIYFATDVMHTGQQPNVNDG